MKTLLAIFACLWAASAAYAGPEVLDIKIEWLNAKACGIEGCKPQRVIMRSGTTMKFGWGPGAELEKRGIFELHPSTHGDSLKLRISRTLGATAVAEDDRMFQMGTAQEIAFKELVLRITITEFQEPNAKK